ncbi:uncharacterized protein DS421_13g413660 [Arachis hypogaea]|nr:uncharacterized protein DS421_13g413660 [Arachis hypogaea]
MTQMKKNPTQCTPIKVNPLLNGQKLDEDDEDGWMCFTFNDSESSRFKDDFYCIPLGISRKLDSFREVPSLSYVGLGPQFSADSRYFHKVAASRRKWVNTVVYNAVVSTWMLLMIDIRMFLSLPIRWCLMPLNALMLACYYFDYFVYNAVVFTRMLLMIVIFPRLYRSSLVAAFEIPQKRLWVLHSMHSGEHNDERSKIHAYAGRIIEDIAKVSIPAYEPTDKGLTRFYPSIPKQHNGCDCGVYVIKFMQYWSLDKPLQFWDKSILQEFQKEIILDIVMGSHNSVIGKALDAFDSHLVYRNQQRNKTKAVRSSFTAPSTKTMLQLVGLPMRKPSKGEDNGRR